MIIITVEVDVRPETREEAVAAALKMAAASQAEAGCHHYQFYSDLQDPNRFFLYELWESEDALEIHRETAHMAEFQKVLPELLTSELRVKRFRVDSLA